LPLEDPADVDETRKASRCKGAARETEQKDLVSRQIVLRDKHVGGANVVTDAKADCARDQLLKFEAGCADAAKIEHDLKNAPRFLSGMNGPRHSEDIRVSALIVGVVPCAVAAYDNPFHDASLRRFPAERIGRRSKIPPHGDHRAVLAVGLDRPNG
jgi:hypothetical protein